jgi:hypothetical protein
VPRFVPYRHPKEFLDGHVFKTQLIELCVIERGD